MISLPSEYKTRKESFFFSLWPYGHKLFHLRHALATDQEIDTSWHLLYGLDLIGSGMLPCRDTQTGNWEIPLQAGPILWSRILHRSLLANTAAWSWTL